MGPSLCFKAAWEKMHSCQLRITAFQQFQLDKKKRPLVRLGARFFGEDIVLGTAIDFLHRKSGIRFPAKIDNLIDNVSV